MCEGCSNGPIQDDERAFAPLKKKTFEFVIKVVFVEFARQHNFVDVRRWSSLHVGFNSVRNLSEIFALEKSVVSQCLWKAQSSFRMSGAIYHVSSVVMRCRKPIEGYKYCALICAAIAEQELNWNDIEKNGITSQQSQCMTFNVPSMDVATP